MSLHTQINTHKHNILLLVSFLSLFINSHKPHTSSPFSFSLTHPFIVFYLCFFFPFSLFSLHPQNTHQTNSHRHTQNNSHKQTQNNSRKHTTICFSGLASLTTHLLFWFASMCCLVPAASHFFWCPCALYLQPIPRSCRCYPSLPGFLCVCLGCLCACVVCSVCLLSSFSCCQFKPTFLTRPHVQPTKTTNKTSNKTHTK